MSIAFFQTSGLHSPFKLETKKGTMTQYNSPADHKNTTQNN